MAVFAVIALIAMAAATSRSAVAFTPAVGIPERACGPLNSKGECTGPAYSGVNDSSSDVPDLLVTPPSDVTDMQSRMSRLARLALAMVNGEPGAMAAYLAELRKPTIPPQPLRPTPRPSLMPDGKIGGIDLATDWADFHALQRSWEDEHPAPPVQSGAQVRAGPQIPPPPNKGGKADNLEGTCDLEFHTSTQNYLCWRKDTSYSLPAGLSSGANCEATPRGRYRGYPVTYCLAACPQCTGAPEQSESTVDDAVEEAEIMSDPAN